MKLWLSLLLLLIGLQGYCSEGAQPAGQASGRPSERVLKLAGSNTLGAQLVPEWARAFLLQRGAQEVTILPLNVENEVRVQGRLGNRYVHIDIAAHGSSTGFIALHQQQADLAIASRPIKDDEANKLKFFGDMRSLAAEHVVAIDGLAIIVHPNNPIRTLSLSALEAIFSGRVTNWSEVGGDDQDIHVYARDENSGTWDTFKHLVLKGRARLKPGVKRFESNNALSDSVSLDAHGIGFVGLASVHQAKALSIMDGDTQALPPEAVFIATEDYPLARRLFIYSPEVYASQWQSKFIQFAQSQVGQNIVENVGFVSQNPVRVAMEPTASASKAYRTITAYGERLSVNFRFKPGSAELDNKAQQDVLRLVRFLQVPENKNLKIQLVGFSRPMGRHQSARSLAKLRATALKLALFKSAVFAEPVIALGDELLLTNQSAQSKKNDRVEVWVLDEMALSEVRKQMLEDTRDHGQLTVY